MSKERYDKLVKTYIDFYTAKPIRLYFKQFIKNNTTLDDITHQQLPMVRLEMDMKQKWIEQFEKQKQDKVSPPSASITFGCDGYICPKCGLQDVTQRTIQTRSIDEPSKHFYFCNNTKCLWRWCED